MMRKCYSVNRSPIDENNDSLSKSWIVFHHGIVAKLTSAAEFSAAEDLAHFYTSKESKYRMVRLKTGHLATLPILSALFERP